MEALDQQVCLDTDVVIAILNNEERASEVIDKIEAFEVYVSVVTIYELFLRETNLNEIEIFRNKVRVLDLTEGAARKASVIFNTLKKKGKIVDFKDIFIAAICIENNCKLVTFNKKDFENINDLKLI